MPAAPPQPTVRWLKRCWPTTLTLSCVQYPQRADRRNHPAADSIGALALELFEAGDWAAAAPLSLFGHCMGAVVAFEFARIAERNGVPVRVLWASAGQAPSTVAASGPLPTSDSDVLADMIDLGGTDPVLLEDEEFVELLVKAVQADYQALNAYSCPPDVRIRADIHAIGGDRDHRIGRECWPAGKLTHPADSRCRISTAVTSTSMITSTRWPGW